MPYFKSLTQLLAAICVIVILQSSATAQTEPAAQQPVAPVDLAQEAEAVDDVSLTEKASLLIGFNIIENMKRQDIELNINKLIEGIQLAASEGELPMDDEEITSVMQAFQRAATQKAREKQTRLQDENLAKGKAFLDENSKRQGVETLENGVQYEILTPGPADAKSPAETDWVKINYKGTLTNGKQFDASKEGEPAEFPVGGVIRGFSAALMQMKVGDKWKIFIPAELGYGKRGSPPRIGPNETLVFEVEMLDVFNKNDE